MGNGGARWVDIRNKTIPTIYKCIAQSTGGRWAVDGGGQNLAEGAEGDPWIGILMGFTSGVIFFIEKVSGKVIGKGGKWGGEVGRHTQ